MSRRSRLHYTLTTIGYGASRMKARLPRSGCLAWRFTFVRCCGSLRASISHGLTAKRAPAALATGDGSCNCLSLMVTSDRSHKGLSPSITAPCPAHLRRLVATLVGDMEPHGQRARVDKLMELIEKARQDRKKLVLSVSRDGVSLGLAPWSFFEIASVACVSVIAGGKKAGNRLPVPGV